MILCPSSGYVRVLYPPVSAPNTAPAIGRPLARIVIASVDTYLRFAEAVNRLDISGEKAGLTDLVGG